MSPLEEYQVLVDKMDSMETDEGSIKEAIEYLELKAEARGMAKACQRHTIFLRRLGLFMKQGNDETLDKIIAKVNELDAVVDAAKKKGLLE